MGYITAIDILVEQGVCTLASWPYDERDYRTLPNEAQRAEAALYRVPKHAADSQFYFIRGINNIKRRLANGDGVVIGVHTFPDLFNLSPSNPIYDEVYGTSAGGHALCLIGYDDNMGENGAFKFINSWGTGWGLGGYGWISYELMNDIRVSHHGVMVGFVMDSPVVYEELYDYTISNGEATITRYLGPGGDIVIPDTLGGEPVTAINARFPSSGVARITSVVIPESVRTIGERAFADCGAMARAYFLGDAPATIGGNIFANNTTIHYLCGKIGWEYPRWNGYRTESPHIYGDWETITESTCAVPGVEARVCSVCYYEETRLITQLHTYGDWVIGREPSCALPGTEVRACSVCHHEVSRNTTRLPHTYGDWELRGEPTCAAVGWDVRVCVMCPHEDFRAILLLPHTYGDWELRREPTCSMQGWKVRICSVCHHENTRFIPRHSPKKTDCTECYHCPAVLPVSCTTANPCLAADSHPSYIYTISNGEATITGYIGMGGDIVIPDTLGGEPVTVIDSWAFYGNILLTGIIIPNGVITIGRSAFGECMELTSVTIPPSVTEIDWYAFRCMSRDRPGAPVWIPLPNLTLRVYENTYAHEYAIENGFPFVIIPRRGDVNGDGVIDSTDVFLLRRWLAATPSGRAAIEDANPNFSIANARVFGGDGEPGHAEAEEIRRWIAAVDKFPLGP
jgi:hypothetical protein